MSSRWEQAGLLEVFVDLESGRLVDRTGPLSNPALAEYLADAGVTLERGARAEINLAAAAWVADVGARLRRGFLVLIDYGYEAAELYSAARSQGTLATYHRHLVDAPGDGAPSGPAWLADPGSRDLTSHVDFTSVRRAADRAGLEPVSDLRTRPASCSTSWNAARWSPSSRPRTGWPTGCRSRRC